MASRSLNRVQLIGNLTRDPELRYTPQGNPVCTFGMATNRSWTTEGGERKEEAEFHRIVAWNKLAELCSQLLFKGRRVFIEGRLQTRAWTAQDGSQRQATEIVIDDMIILDSRRAPGEEVAPAGEAVSVPVEEKPEEVELPEVPAATEEVPSEPATAVPEETVASSVTIPSVAADDQAAAKKKRTIKKTEEKPEIEDKPATDEVKPEDIPF